MSLKTAQRLGLSLARSLMTIIVVIRAADQYLALPLADYDGDPMAIINEYDPFQI